MDKRNTFASILEENLDKTDKVSELIQYVDHVKHRGEQVLKTMDLYISNKLQLKSRKVDIGTMIHNYTKQVQKYFDKTVPNKQEPVYSEDIIMIDTAEVACRLLYQSQMKLLNDTLDAFHNSRSTKKIYFGVPTNVTKHIMDTIKENSTYIKSEEMQYICMNYRICRHYPAFTDHCGHFVTDILQMPKNKLTIFQKLLGMIVSHNENFINMVVDIKKDKNTVEHVLKEIVNIDNIKKFFYELKETLSLKFEILHNPKNRDKMKAAALRMLLDVIDKLYEKEDGKLILTKFDLADNSIKKWVRDEISSISVVTVNFITELFKFLDKIIHSNKDTKTTIYNLIEILVGDNTVMHEDYYNAVLGRKNEL